MCKCVSCLNKAASSVTNTDNDNDTSDSESTSLGTDDTGDE